MKRKILIIIAMLSFVSAVCFATPVDFNLDGTIQNGDVYLDVHVHNTATVNMTGGQVDREFDVYQSGTVNLSNGTVSVFQIFDTGKIDITGGRISSLNVYNSGIANLRGGQITDNLMAWDAGIVNIYGYGFKSNTQGSIYLSGYWGNGESFNIWLRGGETPSHVVLHEIPEPATLLLFALGTALRGLIS